MDDIAIQRYTELLSRSSIFFGISRIDLKELIAKSKCMDVPANTPLIEENQLVEGLHCILEGAVHVQKGETEIARFQQGSFFGEISLYGLSFVATATVRSLTECKFLKIERYRLEYWFKEHPEAELGFLRNLATELCNRLIATTDLLGRFGAGK